MRRFRWTLGAVAAGLVVAVVATFPLAAHLGRTIPTLTANCDDGRCVDDWLCVWIVTESGRRLYADPLHVFEANILHPLRHTLAYSESMLSAGALTAPVARLTGNPILAYDLYYLATYVLSVLGAFLLAREATGDPRAALLAGVVFGLAGERWWYRGHLAAISAQWAPFVMYFWLRMVEAPRARTAVALGLVVWAHVLASAYHALMLPVLLALWAVPLYLGGPWPRRAWLVGTATLAAAFAIGLSAYLPYLVVAQEIPYAPDYIGAHWWNWLRLAGTRAGPLVFGPRTRLLPSLVAPALLVTAAVVARRRPAPEPPPVAARAHLYAALVLWLAAAALATDPILPHVPGPFRLLHALPGFASMRSPWRFTLLAALGRALVVAIAAAFVLRRIRRPGRAWAVVGGLLAAIVVESHVASQPMPLTRVPTPGDLPAVYRWLAGTPPDTAVLELPTSRADDVHYMLWSLYHGHPLANGYTAVRPELYRIGPDFPTDADLASLRDAGIRYVIAHPDRLDASVLAAIERRTDLVRARFDDAVVLEVPADAPPPAPPPCCELAPVHWHVTATDPGAERAADGDLTTHWQPPPGSRDSALRIDLDADYRVTGITLRFGPHVLEFPRRYTVRASRDGVTWVTIGDQPNVEPPWASYRRDHRDVELRLRLRAVVARHVEIRVPAAATPPRLALTAPLPNWGVHELRVYAVPAGDGP
jgi:hypothetical protein